MAVVAELKGKLNGYQAAGVPYIDAEDPLTSSVFESIEVMDPELALGRVVLGVRADVLAVALTFAAFLDPIRSQWWIATSLGG